MDFSFAFIMIIIILNVNCLVYGVGLATAYGVFGESKRRSVFNSGTCVTTGTVEVFFKALL